MLLTVLEDYLHPFCDSLPMRDETTCFALEDEAFSGGGEKLWCNSESGLPSLLCSKPRFNLEKLGLSFQTIFAYRS